MDQYLVLPDAENPKYVLPLSDHRVTEASLSLYAPLTLLRRIQVLLFRLLIKLGVLNFFIPKRFIAGEISRFLSTGKSVSFIQWVNKILGVPASKLAVYTGVPGYYRKTTVQIMSNDGRILGYAKIAESPQSKTRLRHEIRVLKLLRSLKITGASYPQALGFKETDRELIILLSAPSTNYTLHNLQMTGAICTFLSDMFNKSKTRHEFTASPPFECTCQRVERVVPRLSSTWKEPFQKARRILSERMSNEEIVCGLCHYDFKPWNLKINRIDDRLFVFDWEFARTCWAPLVDLFNFIVQPAFLVRRLKPESVFEGILNPNSTMKQVIAAYMQGINLDSRYYLYMFLFYLLDSSIHRLEKLLQGGNENAADDSLTLRLRSLLDLCIEYLRVKHNSGKGRLPMFRVKGSAL